VPGPASTTERPSRVRARVRARFPRAGVTRVASLDLPRVREQRAFARVVGSPPAACQQLQNQRERGFRETGATGLEPSSGVTPLRSCWPLSLGARRVRVLRVDAGDGLREARCKHDRPHSTQQPLGAIEEFLGSRRAANALNRPDVKCTKLVLERRRPASIERLHTHRRQSSFPWNKPVTPEVAGSSPVAPASGSACKRAPSVASTDGIRGSRRRRLLPDGILEVSSFGVNNLPTRQFRARAISMVLRPASENRSFAGQLPAPTTGERRAVKA
jgi:hypothetical protein